MAPFPVHPTPTPAPPCTPAPQCGGADRSQWPGRIKNLNDNGTFAHCICLAAPLACAAPLAVSRAVCQGWMGRAPCFLAALATLSPCWQSSASGGRTCWRNRRHPGGRLRRCAGDALACELDICVRAFPQHCFFCSLCPRLWLFRAVGGFGHRVHWHRKRGWQFAHELDLLSISTADSCGQKKVPHAELVFPMVATGALSQAGVETALEFV